MQNENLEEEFSKLCSNYKYSEALELFNRGLQYSFDDTSYEHPLILAIKYRKYDIAIKLIRNNVDVNIKHKDTFKTPIFYAIEQNAEDIYHLLVQAGAKLNLEDNNRDTLLMTAIGHGSSRIALDLIQRGVDINIQNPKSHETALMCAVSKSFVPLVVELLKRGADPDAIGSYGSTAFLSSITSHKTYIAEKLLEYVKDINLYTQEGSALHLAIKNNMPNLVYKIMQMNFQDQKLDVNLMDSDGNSPLMLAIKNNMPDLAVRLIDAGANIHLINKAKKHAVTLAIENNDLVTLPILLEKGGDISDIQNLQFAVSKEKPDLLLSLIEYGALRSHHFSEISNAALTKALTKREWCEMQRVLFSHGAVPPQAAEFENYHIFDRQVAAIVQLPALRDFVFARYESGEIIFASRALAIKCSGHHLIDKAISHGKHIKFLQYIDLWLEKGAKVGFSSCDQFNKYHKIVYRDVNFINFTKTCKNILDSSTQTSGFQTLNPDILSEILGHVSTTKEKEYGQIYYLHQDLNYDIGLLGQDF
jgi:ankyrin repeat protein